MIDNMHSWEINPKALVRRSEAMALLKRCNISPDLFDRLYCLHESGVLYQPKPLTVYLLRRKKLTVG